MTKKQLYELRRLLVSLKRDIDSDSIRITIARSDFDPVWAGLVGLLESAEKDAGLDPNSQEWFDLGARPTPEPSLPERETATRQIPSARGDIAASGPRNGPSPEPAGELAEDVNGRDCEIAFNAVLHYVGSETAHLKPAEQFHVFKRVARSLESDCDEMVRDAAASLNRPCSGEGK